MEERAKDSSQERVCEREKRRESGKETLRAHARVGVRMGASERDGACARALGNARARKK